MTCKTICIENFCGTYANSAPANSWADYCPTHKVTVFGGDWADIPPMGCDAAPTDAECAAWVRAFREGTPTPHDTGSAWLAKWQARQALTTGHERTKGCTLSYEI
jgi:hypothetical protein